MIRIADTDTVLSEKTVEAATIFGRMRGMLGRDFSDFDAMVFRRNNSIHMFFMAMPLDCIFLDKDSCVTSVRETLKPWRMAADFKASAVIELPAGTLADVDLGIGHRLEITVDSTM